MPSDTDLLTYSSYLVEGEETLHLEKPENSIGEMKSFYGNFLVVVKALTYIKTLGREGIPEASQNAVLNTVVQETFRNIHC